MNNILPIQLELPIKDRDTNVTNDKWNLLKVSEIQDAGFEYVTHTAFVYNEETGDHVVVSQSHPYVPNTIPKLALTYLVDECHESEYFFNSKYLPFLKDRVIKTMREMNFHWVYQVYLGEIFIPKNSRSARMHHIFVRGAIDKTKKYLRYEI